MPVKLECPRCKQSLAVPSKLLGTYALCPRCKGRIWIAAPEGAPAPAKAGDASAALAPPAASADHAAANSSPGAPPAERSGSAPGWTPPLAPSSPLSPGRRPAPTKEPADGAPGLQGPAGNGRPQPGTAAPATAPGLPVPGLLAPRGGPPAPPAPPVPAPPIVATRKTARLISPEAAASSLQVAADGKLPELHLDDGARTIDTDAKGKAISPLLLTAILCLSASFSMVAVMTDFEAPNPAVARRKSEARQRIEAHYFPLVADHARARPAENYQRFLAEASRAHARGDRLTERRMYNRVLGLLRAERGRFQRGLTGSQDRDKELERLIIVLLGED